MNQSEDFGKILKPWPNLVDHFKYMQGLLSRIDGRVVFPMVMALHNKNN